MYKKKSEIIKQIQSFHKQLYVLYCSLYEKERNQQVKMLLSKLCQNEKNKEEYLERHKKIAMAMDNWLDFPAYKVSNLISDCFRDIKTGPSLSVNDVIKIESYFDNCLLKLFRALSTEEMNNGNITNIFYYMIKKTKQNETYKQEETGFK